MQRFFFAEAPEIFGCAHCGKHVRRYEVEMNLFTLRALRGAT